MSCTNAVTGQVPAPSAGAAELVGRFGPLLNTREAAQLCRCSQSHLRAMCQRGELPCVRIGSRWLIRTAELAQMLGFEG